MKVNTTKLEGLLVIEPDSYQDERGFFLETYQEKRYKEARITETFVQDNQSRSKKNILRGLHFQIKQPQAQLVTVIRGRVFDVAVDLRQSSKTFGEWFGVELSDDGMQRQIYMAPGFAHGFCVLSDWADLHYKVSRIYEVEDEGGLVWNDRDVNILWPCISPQIHQRDAVFPTLAQLGENQLPLHP